MRGRGAQSLAASPTLVGAITTLIIIVAVFLAYNANNGLPFVPVYRISVDLADASRLAKNNEVRIGGTRVGVVESIEPYQDPQTGKAAAKLNLKLNKSVQPLPKDTTAEVRYRSAFGLKYLQLTRGNGPPLAEGSTIPINRNAPPTSEFDDIANTFNRTTNENVRVNLEGYGNALAARGASLNEAIQNLNPLFANLLPVAQTLAAPGTRLNNFFLQLANTARIVVPVAVEQSQLFTNAATTFAAISSDPAALQATIAEGVPTLEVGTASLRILRPFVVNLTDLSRLLRPGVHELRLTLPGLNQALAVGTPVLLRLPPVNNDLAKVFTNLEAIVDQPETLTTLQRLQETFNQAKPAVDWIVPAQTVCDYWNYWFTYLPEHLSQRDQVGYSQRVNVIMAPGALQAHGSLGGYSGIQANGQAGPATPGMFTPHTLPILHGSPYAASVTSSGKADCQNGQTGYPLGFAPVPGQSKANPAVGTPNLPGVRGPTFHGRSQIP